MEKQAYKAKPSTPAASRPHWPTETTGWVQSADRLPSSVPSTSNTTYGTPGLDSVGEGMGLNVGSSVLESTPGCTNGGCTFPSRTTLEEPGCMTEDGQTDIDEKSDNRLGVMGGGMRNELFDFHGVSMIHTFTDSWEKMQNFKALPDDILIATYPKAGTTWMSYVLDLLYFKQKDKEREKSVAIFDRVPFLENTNADLTTGVETAESLTTRPRLIKTHLPIQFVPKSFWDNNCRIVYMSRNAKDSAVSYYHHHRMAIRMPDPQDWNSFLERFMEGKVVFGSWYDHVTGWWDKKQTYPNLLFMFYEDMVQDTSRELERLCSFLGLSTSVEERERIRGGVQFDAMKANPMANYSTNPIMDQRISPFMRKGKVGDWKSHFTVAQNESFDEHYKMKMKNTTLTFKTAI